MSAAVLAERFAMVQARIAAACARANRPVESVTLVAVTKTIGPETAALLPSLGITNMGENRPQELGRKAAMIPGVRWHMVGHLQRNKIDKLLPDTHLIHSVDSERLLLSLHEAGQKRGSPVSVLLELNCSREEAKGGFDPAVLPEIVSRFPSLPGVRVEGLMTMAAAHPDPEDCRATFRELRELRDQHLPGTGLSMGMSNDFEVAIEEGATWVRIGSTLFADLT
ncbi:MAG: YggS family pyridoxal phosphate-dependent enzyme [Fimbriiglobus sp.]